MVQRVRIMVGAFLVLALITIPAHSEVFDVNCDGQEGLAEAIHALQVASGLTPGKEDCNSSIIVLDGNIDDWSSIQPLKTDPQGDDLNGEVTGDDIKAISSIADAEYIYLLLELYEDANESFMNFPYPNNKSYRFEVNSHDLDFGLAFDFFDSIWKINAANSGGTPTFQGADFVAVSGGNIEIKIPLTELSNPTLQDVSAAAYSCCNPPEPNYNMDEIVYP